MEEQTKLSHYISRASRGTREDVDSIMGDLNMDMSIADSKFIDYALGLVNTVEGIEAMTYYLFHGSQVQRNYCTLYFCRKGEYPLVRKAYDMGLVDAKQAFSR